MTISLRHICTTMFVFIARDSWSVRISIVLYNCKKHVLYESVFLCYASLHHMRIYTSFHCSVHSWSGAVRGLKTRNPQLKPYISYYTNQKQCYIASVIMSFQINQWETILQNESNQWETMLQNENNQLETMLQNESNLWETMLQNESFWVAMLSPSLLTTYVWDGC